MTNLVQAINLPSLYATGLGMSWMANKETSIAAGQIRNRENTFDITFDSSVAIDATKNGAGGLDTGTIALNTWYRVFVIYQKTGYSLPSAVISASDIPTLPTGYDDYIRVGWLRTDASSNFNIFYQTGNGNVRTYEWRDAINVLTSGSATSYTNIDLKDAVPPVDLMPVVFKAEITPNSAGNYLAITRASTSTSAALLTGSVAAVNQIAELTALVGVVSSNANIDYKVENAADVANLDVRQFVDYI